MSFFDKPTWVAPPGLGDFQSYLKDWLGTGPSGPEFAWGRGVMRQLRKGTFNPENDAVFKAYADPVTAGYGVSLREGLRENQMNSALLPGQQGIISQALNDQLASKMGDQKGMAMRGVLQDYLNRAFGAYDTGQNRYLQMAGIAIPQLGQTYRDYIRETKPGLLSQIGQIAGVGGQLAGLITGIPGLGPSSAVHPPTTQSIPGYDPGYPQTPPPPGLWGGYGAPPPPPPAWNP